MINGLIDSWYSRTVPPVPERPSLDGEVTADVCVIGGGLAGLNVALGLAERGKSVVVLEGRRIGFGASGRNGGFCIAGYSLTNDKLVKRIGLDRTKRLFALSQEAMKLIRDRIGKYDIPCNPVEGMIEPSWFNDEDGMRRHVDKMGDVYGEPQEFWPREKVRELYRTERYRAAVFQKNAFHMHPLAYTQGLAKAAESHGVKIYENTMVTSADIKRPDKIVRTATGTVKAGEVVFCMSGYGGNSFPPLTRYILPVATYVMVTEPLGDRLETAIRAPYAVYDTRIAPDYYRPLPDSGGQILWGGRISARKATPQEVAKMMTRDMLRVYPQLEGTKVDVAWDGYMGYAVHKMPQIRQFRPGAWVCTGFGGQGLNPTAVGGELIAKAIVEGDDTYRIFDPFGFIYTMGVLGPAFAQMHYWWMTLKDETNVFLAR